MNSILKTCSIHFTGFDYQIWKNLQLHMWILRLEMVIGRFHVTSWPPCWCNNINHLLLFGTPTWSPFSLSFMSLGNEWKRSSIPREIKDKEKGGHVGVPNNRRWLKYSVVKSSATWRPWRYEKTLYRTEWSPNWVSAERESDLFSWVMITGGIGDTKSYYKFRARSIDSIPE